MAETDAELHARHDHPDYEYKITHGPRKTWQDADVPPEGEGWERNVDAGYPGEGWERFDYIERSFWRRRKTEAELVENRQDERFGSAYLILSEDGQVCGGSLDQMRAREFASAIHGLVVIVPIIADYRSKIVKTG